MDIDETTLTNWCEMRREDFGYVASLYRAWEVSPEAATGDPGRAAAVQRGACCGRRCVLHHGPRPGMPDRSAAAGGRKDETDGDGAAT